MALTKVTGQVINDSTGLVVGVTTVGGGLSATDGFFSGIVTAVGDASFSGNVSVAGTLTYEDVTNIDSVGLITARNGIVVGSGITLSKDGDVFFTGIATGNGSGLTNLTAGNLTGALPAISGASLTGMASTDNVRTGILDVAGISTFRNTVNIGAAVTISESGIEATGVGITVANINGGQIGGRRNVLINGAMQVVQRGTSFTDVGSSSDTFTLDRWKFYIQNSSARFTVTQDSDSPDEFGGSMKIDCTTTDTSLASTDEVYLEQRLEGQDLQHFAKGTSSAKQYTLSFYAKTTKTGTYIVNLLSRDNTAGMVSAAYTVSDTNWNRYVITFPADTNSNRKDDNDNGEALRLQWWFVAGSAVNSGTLNTSWANTSDTGRATGQLNFADSTSNIFYLTGCQLEVGPQASAYEHRSFGEELKLCERYYQRKVNYSNQPFGVGNIDGANQGQLHITFITSMRQKPTLETTGSAGDYGLRVRSTQTCTGVPTMPSLTASTDSVFLEIPRTSHGFTDGQAAFCVAINTGAYLAFDAEL